VADRTGAVPDRVTGGDAAPGLAALVARLERAELTVAVAESLTGGLVLGALTTVPGVSAVLRGGVVVYATDTKASQLGVDAELLRERGPVDPDVALAMARGVRRRWTSDIGLATTGVAGPEPQDGHPVGEVYIAVADRAAGRAERLVVPHAGTLDQRLREQIRAATVRSVT
jgi:PncC family amidohydrolase